jgi:hypothetical protein
MADVFISYPKADRPLALKLAAMLEAEAQPANQRIYCPTIAVDFKHDRRIP